MVQQSPASLAIGTSFTKDNFFHSPGVGGWFQDDLSASHLSCTLFLLLYHLPLKSSGIRSRRVGDLWSTALGSVGIEYSLEFLC